MNEEGVALTCWLESFKDIHSGTDLASRFRGLEGTGIPYGTYDYMLARGAPGTTEQGNFSGRITVETRDQLAVVMVDYRNASNRAAGDTRIPPDFTIQGRIEPLPAAGPIEEPLWIRLTPIYKQGSMDVSVDASGVFRIYRPLTGRYIVVVIRGREVLVMQQISFESEMSPKPFVIRLPKGPPERVRVQ